MNNLRKKILFINRVSPYSTTKAQETLDILLMASTFDQEISVLFLDDGVLQLKNNQQPETILQKKFTAAYQALSLYDVNNVFVCGQSLRQRNLQIKDLITDVTIINADQIKVLLNQQHTIINC